MIKIDDEYRINSDAHCYHLEIVGKVEDKDSKNYGQERVDVYGYYSSIESCLRGYIKAKTRKYIAENTLNTLDELLKQIEEWETFVAEKFKKY